MEHLFQSEAANHPIIPKLRWTTSEKGGGGMHASVHALSLLWAKLSSTYFQSWTQQRTITDM